MVWYMYSGGDGAGLPSRTPWLAMCQSVRHTPSYRVRLLTALGIFREMFRGGLSVICALRTELVASGSLLESAIAPRTKHSPALHGPKAR